MRIGIVNDVSLAVEAVRRVVSSGQHEVAWIARDGAEAVACSAADRPNLILMDLIMPVMDGVEATRRIMANTPCAIVIVTANVDENCSKVFEAMGAGALDAVNTPVMENAGPGTGGIALLAKIETIRKLLGAQPQIGAPASLDRSFAPANQPQDQLVVLGASAGGPAALAKLLAALPADFPAPMIIVQHVDAHFAPGLADWLDQQTPLRVGLAQTGDRPEPGRILLAGADQHLVLSSPFRLAYTPEPADCSYRPSIDVFFRSVERHWLGEVVAVLLTGMGRDGAEGLKALHDRGHHTIAQDELSSAVYGMPKAAVELGAVSETLALDQLGPRLASLAALKLKVHG